METVGEAPAPPWRSLSQQFAPSAMLAPEIHFLSPPVLEDGDGAPCLCLTFHPQHFIHFPSTSRWLWLNWLISMIHIQNYRQLSRGGIRQGEGLGRDGAGGAVKFCGFFSLPFSSSPPPLRSLSTSRELWNNLRLMGFLHILISN